MVSKLALFPLKTVVFPGENLPLHIFEDKYSDLIHDCETQGLTFGIPAYVDAFMEYGTEVELVKVVETYPDGAKDILCKGLRIFKIKDIIPRQEGKNYGGGKVQFLKNIENGSNSQREQLTALILELYTHLEMPPPKISARTIDSYKLSHKIGLSLQQEYTLLKLTSEKERLEFLINHLCIIIPVVQEMNRTKSVIEMNGHFKNFDPMDFEDFKIQK